MITHSEPGTSNAELIRQLQRFWEIEEGPNRTFQSPEDKMCEKQYTETISRTPEGRYVVRMPLNDKIQALGRSKASATRQFLSQERRMNTNREFGDNYRAFMKEFKDLGHMTEIQDDVEEGYYTPHHGVISAGKFRTVFNSSHPTSTGISLNDCQRTGPKLQADLSVILNRFRTHRYAMTADIVKMFRQIEIHPDDRKYQKIIWRDSPEEELKVYQNNRIAYGQAAAPFLALRTLKQCALDHKDQLLVAVWHIQHCFYVDDLLTGDSERSGLEILQRNISDVLKEGCLPLAKWCSNAWSVHDQLEVTLDVMMKPKF